MPNWRHECRFDIKEIKTHFETETEKQFLTNGLKLCSYVRTYIDSGQNLSDVYTELSRPWIDFEFPSSSVWA